MGPIIDNISAISIAVASIDHALPTFTDQLGMEVTKPVQASPRGFPLRWVGLGAEGRTFFELLEPTRDEGPIAKFLARGSSSSIYQARTYVEDIEVTVARLKEQGFRVLERRVDGHPGAAWIHPRDAHGVLFEIIERS